MILLKDLAAEGISMVYQENRIVLETSCIWEICIIINFVYTFIMYESFLLNEYIMCFFDGRRYKEQTNSQMIKK